jgi:hypothetical protein
MKHIGIVKKDTLVSIINWVGIPIIFSYLICMIVFPFVMGGWNWEYVQKVWDRWQTINAGFLALISSVIAFNISRFTENQKRQRQFVAARAFLPHALSELTAYCKSSSIVLREALSRTTASGVGREAPLLAVVPALPIDYKDTFRQCIGFAEPNVAYDMANILVKLQIHDSRMNQLKDLFPSNGHTVLLQRNVMSYLFSLGKLQAKINKIFNFSRGEEDFDESGLIWEDYRTAYSNLNIIYDDIEELEEFTRRAISRESDV